MRSLLLNCNKGLIRLSAAVALCLMITGTTNAQKVSGSTEAMSIDTEQTELLMGEQDKRREIDVRVYPNPSSGIFNVTTENNADIQVFNRIMKPIIVPIQNLLNMEHRIDLTDVVGGVYYIQVTTSYGMATKQLLKQ